MLNYTLLEAGLGNIIIGLIFIFGSAALIISFTIAFVFKYVYQHYNKRKLSGGSFWLTVFVCLCICGLITGAMCL